MQKGKAGIVLTHRYPPVKKPPAGNRQAAYFLHFSHPQAVEIAIGVNRNSFIISQAEGDIGFVIGFQSLALSNVFGLDIDPLDEVFRKHRMDFLRAAA